MRLKSSRFALLLLLVLGCGAAYGQDSPGARPKKARTPDDYKPRTLKEVAAEAAGAESRGNKEETMVVYGDILPSRARATYAGSARPLPLFRKEVLRQWARLYAGYPEGFTGPYQTEMLFNEGGTDYWLAVRKEALPRYERELKKGDAVDLYLIRVGAAKTSGGWEPVLLIENVRKPN